MITGTWHYNQLLITRRELIIRRDTNNGDAWLIVSCLVIFFFIFQWFIIYSVVTIQQCDLLSTFWLASGQDGISVFKTVCLIFGLVLLWSIIDLVRAVYLDYDDKIFSIVVFLGVFTCSVFTARTLWAQWELFQIESGLLTAEQSKFLDADWGIILLKDDYKREMGIRICEAYGVSYNR